jgi:DNA-directed RNA polymerase beta subunit
MAKFSSVKDFSKSKPLIAPFNLNEAQLKSYQWFLKRVEGNFRRDLADQGPYRKRIRTPFFGYRFDEPKHDEATARYKEATYEAPLRCTLRLSIRTPAANRSRRSTSAISRS